MFVLDIYTFYGIKQIFADGKWLRQFTWFYFSISAIGYFAIGYLYFNLHGGPFSSRTPMVNYMIGIVFTLFISKLVFSAVQLIHDLVRITIGIISFITSLVTEEKQLVQHIPERREFLTKATTMIAGIPFIGLLYGITRGKYAYTIERVSIAFKDLPKAFDGFKIVQISDIHSGSFDSISGVKEGIHMINSLDADIVCFTGDLVNSEKEEIDPYIDIFSQISARYGKYAVLGNHDYYGRDARDEGPKRDVYFADFFTRFEKMGFDLLNNANRKLSLDGDVINIIGVENWGAGRWFPKRGDLDVATKNLPDNGFNILLSHDPSHWDAKVLGFPKTMHLTLSGHTHGMQFGIKIPGFEWSPVKYRYPRWMGLYKENDQYLYVNRGFGFLAFPGRVGMWPEITLIELRTA
jgi:hypothetical protein